MKIPNTTELPQFESGSYSGQRDFERWYIGNRHKEPEQIFHIAQRIDDAETERETQNMTNDFNFVFDNGFYIPNTEELSKLATILEKGRLDGCETVRPTL